MFFKKKKRENESILELDMERIPGHIAIIMDGNGRWAKEKGMPRVAGHKAGVETIRTIVKASDKLGVKVLTVYAFSTENWSRPLEEVNALMDLLVVYLNNEVKELHENNVKINAIGNLNGLPDKAHKKLLESMAKTGDNTGLILNLALNYGGRHEITNGVKKIAEKVKNGELDVENIDEALIGNHLYTAGLPDPDLMIRTSGELRLSNYLLWQLAYSEFYFTDLYWPDFDESALKEAIWVYQNRDRRFGGIKEKKS